jgi:hypothetical protein
MKPEEAALWAAAIKLVLDQIGGGKTVDDLEKAIADEEVRSKVLEAERRR